MNLRPSVLEQDMDMFCTDINSIEFVISYANKIKEKEEFWLLGDEFKDCFYNI